MKRNFTAPMMVLLTVMLCAGMFSSGCGKRDKDAAAGLNAPDTAIAIRVCADYGPNKTMRAACNTVCGVKGTSKDCASSFDIGSSQACNAGDTQCVFDYWNLKKAYKNGELIAVIDEHVGIPAKKGDTLFKLGYNTRDKVSRNGTRLNKLNNKSDDILKKLSHAQPSPGSGPRAGVHPPAQGSGSNKPGGSERTVTGAEAEAAELYTELQKALAGDYEEKEGKKGTHKHTCIPVRKLLAKESLYKPFFSYANWEGDVMGAKKDYCEKKINIVAQKTVRNITQGTCANYVFDKALGRSGVCDPSISKVMEGYTYTSIGTYAAVKVLPPGKAREQVAGFGDKRLGLNDLAKYKRNNASYKTPGGTTPQNPVENKPPDNVGNHNGPGGTGTNSNNNSDIIGNSGITFDQSGTQVPGRGQPADYDINKTPMPSGKGAGEDKSSTLRSDYDQRASYKTPNGTQSYKAPK